MNNKKCILLVRVSTEKQNFDEQERELYNLAISEGFAESDIIPICEKESGIKLKEEERKGLNQLKELIAGGNISTVYAWEVSRIARKKIVLFSVTDFLINNKVQLIIKDPYLKLLNPDGSINDGAETILTLYAQIAESEMRQKKARWHRTNVAKSRNGQWHGGHPVRFGYNIDENYYYIINEEEAEIIRKTFEIYNTTNLGTTGVVRELAKLGYNLTYHRVRNILIGECYTGKLLRPTYFVKDESGKCKKTVGLELKYPAIISEETFEKAKKRRASNNSNAYKRDSYYFGRGLIRCQSCGNVFAAVNANGWYVCCDYSTMNRKVDGSFCHNHTTIGINVMDTLLWDAAVSEFICTNRNRKDSQKRELRAKIKDLQKVIDATDDRLEKNNIKLKRNALIYSDGEIDDDVYNKRKEQIKKERAEIEQDRISAMEKIAQYEKIISSSDSVSIVDTINTLSEEAFSMNELREMCELVHTYISHAKIDEEDKRIKYVTVYAVSGAIYKYKYQYKSLKQIYYRKADMIVMQSFSPWVEFTPNIIIRRKTGHLRKDKTMTKPFILIRNNEVNYNVQNQMNLGTDKKASSEFIDKKRKK